MDEVRRALPGTPERARTVWLVAGQAVYRVAYRDDETVICKVEAGSDRVLGRTVEFPRTQIQAALNYGELRAVGTRPRWVSPDASSASRAARQGPPPDERDSTGSATGTKKRTVKKGKVR